MNRSSRSWLLALPLALMLGTVACDPGGGSSTDGGGKGDGGGGGGGDGGGGGGGGGDGGGGTACPTPLNEGCGTGGVAYEDRSLATASRTVTFQTLPDAGGEYTPRCITIARGQSVTIQASGGTTFQSHNMSQRCGPVGNLFTQKTGSSKTITFNTAGDYGYYCDFHPGSAMSGSIRVQ